MPTLFLNTTPTLYMPRQTLFIQQPSAPQGGFKKNTGLIRSPKPSGIVGQ